MSGFQKLRDFAKREPYLYGAIFSFVFVIVLVFFMVGDLVIKGKSNLSPFWVLPFLIYGVYCLYKKVTK